LFDLSYPLLYWDPQKDFSIVLTQKKEVTNLDSKKSILCRRPEQFLFAFQCMDLGLDLKKMLRLRKKAEDRLDRKLNLIDWDEKKQAALLKSGNDYFWVVYEDKNE
ncbi:MAG: hypothetical protein HUJ55_04490, partial [Ileibacterium sp.]|nr:hypothetical protein [Ileibacterium sp.]